MTPAATRPSHDAILAGTRKLAEGAHPPAPAASGLMWVGLIDRVRLAPGSVPESDRRAVRLAAEQAAVPGGF